MGYLGYFYEKGWSGNFEGVLPTLSAPLAVDGAINPLLARGSLADFLGFNLSDYKYKSGDEDITVILPAMPFLAYQLIYRSHYLNFNVASAYAQANPGSELNLFFPDSDYDLMLQGVNPTGLTLDGSNRSDVSQPLNNLAFGKIRYRDFAPDYFTSALPWPMRGDTPTIEGVNGVVGVAPDDNFMPLSQRFAISSEGFVSSVVANTQLSVGLTDLSLVNSSVNAMFSDGASGKLANNFTTLPLRVGDLSLTQPMLKLLWTNTLISEKMAKTDGSYGQFIKTFFGEIPSHWNSHLPEYLGGTYQPVVFSEVLQTSPLLLVLSVLSEQKVSRLLKVLSVVFMQMTLV